MEFKKCSRCGNFYVSNGMVCPKCTPKDEFEFSTFKTYITENGKNNSVESISNATGISVKNLNRFMESESFQENDFTSTNNMNKNTDGITFLI